MTADAALPDRRPVRASVDVDDLDDLDAELARLAAADPDLSAAAARYDQVAFRLRLRRRLNRNR